MKIIVDIPTNMYILCINDGYFFDNETDIIRQAIKDSTKLEDIKAEIMEQFEGCDICEYFEDYDYEENDISEYRPIGNIADVLQIIDKYKTESEM